MPRTDSAIPGVTIQNNDSSGLITLGQCAGAPSSLATAASKFAVGCQLTDTNTGIAYVMNGTVAAPTWRPEAGPTTAQVVGGTIATTSTSDAYVVVPEAGILASAEINPLVALTAHDTNFITWTITNLGQAGAGSAAMLATSPAGINTTKVTGGTALGVNTKYSMTLSGTAANLAVAAGDKILIRATASGTLANTVTVPVYILRFTPTAQV